MTEREKIIDILNKNFTQEVECTPVYTTADGKEIELPQELCDIFNDIVTQAVIPYFADALIAAGIGDMSKQRLLVGKDGTVKQLYSGEEVEKIVNERDEYKHRAEVAEQKATAWKDCANKWQKYYKEQAAREIEEEKGK